MAFERLVRFVPAGDDSKILIGEPVDSSVDVGLAIRKGEKVEARVFSGASALEPGTPTDQVAAIGRLLSPLSAEEVGAIRCIGLNYKKHAAEFNMAIPDVPTVFLKPSAALADPWPAPTIVPKHTLKHNSADYESELAIVIGKTAKNVSVADALDYVLGYTAANDVSSRDAQMAQSQWSYSKGFDGSCPIGPVLVSAKTAGDVKKLKMRGLLNGKVMQESGLDDLIFSVAEIVSFVSSGTTLPKGTVIITGTPAGVGGGRKPPVFLGDGDEFTVEILPHIGSLTTIYTFET